MSVMQSAPAVVDVPDLEFSVDTAFAISPDLRTALIAAGCVGVAGIATDA